MKRSLLALAILAGAVVVAFSGEMWAVAAYGVALLGLVLVAPHAHARRQ